MPLCCMVFRGRLVSPMVGAARPERSRSWQAYGTESSKSRETGIREQGWAVHVACTFYGSVLGMGSTTLSRMRVGWGPSGVAKLNRYLLCQPPSDPGPIDSSHESRTAWHIPFVADLVRIPGRATSAIGRAGDPVR